MRFLVFAFLLSILACGDITDAETLNIYNGETAKFGGSTTWDKNGSSLVQTNVNPYSKPRHLRANIIVKDWWGGAAYVLNKWQAKDLSGAVTLSMAIKSPRPLLISLYDANGKDSKRWELASTNNKYQVVKIPMAGLSGVDLSKIQAIVFAMSLPANKTFRVDIDDIKIDRTIEPTPTPTPDPTPDPTPTVTPTPDPTPAPVPSGVLNFGTDGRLQIHTIGDSITENPGWRTYIYNELKKAGYATDFIGSMTDQWPQTTEKEHDGHSGWGTQGVIDNMDSWYAQILKPELTIVMIGTNDVAWWVAEPMTSTVARLATIVDKVLKNSPSGVIFVATIPPESPKLLEPNKWDRAKLVVEYNKGVVNLVAARQALGEKVYLADVNAALTLSDLVDGIHPSDAGNIKVGKVFVDKIKSMLPAAAPTPAPIPSPTVIPIPTPPPGTTATFKVNGRFLYDSCGEKVVLRGYNNMTCWTDWDGTPRDGLPVFPEMAKTGANVVRIVWIYNEGTTAVELDRAITNAYANKMIPMIEIHNQTCKWSTDAVTEVLNYWLKPDVIAVLWKHQKYLLLNFANEMGDWSTTKDSYVKEYTRATLALRQAGFHAPIVFDSSKCGQDENMILQAAPALIQADPDHNLIFSLHIYWTDQDSNRIIKAVTDSVNAGIPMIIGEFASTAVDCKTPIDYKEIIRQGQLQQIGWLPWSWDVQQECMTMSMTSDWTAAGLRGAGLEMAITDPNSVKNTSVIPYSVANGRCR